MAKENESCQNYRLQEVVNYTWNRPASWPLNVRQAAKIKINIEFKTLHSIIYPLERKERKYLRDENVKVTFH